MPANTFFTSTAPSPHQDTLNYNGVKAPYTNIPAGSNPPIYGIPVKPPNGEHFQGSVKSFLGQFRNAFIISH